jgi:long-chain acyl-CoA synthetase
MTQLAESRDVAAERAEIDAEIAGGTLLTAFAETVQRLDHREALKWKQAGGWRGLTWNQYRDAAEEVTLGLRERGFRPGDCALVMSRNRPEAYIADLGILHARGVPVFVYNTLAPEQIAYLANHCQATVAVLEDRGFLAKFEAVRSQLLNLRRVVLIDGEPGPGDDWVSTWEDLRAAGRQAAERSPGAFAESWQGVTPDDVATLIYTSGTTGPPKGAMITHRSARWTLASMGAREKGGPDDRVISYLPLAHAAEHVLTFAHQLVRGFTVHMCPDAAQLFEVVRDARPTFFGGVPRVWEKLHSALTSAIAGDPDTTRREAAQAAIGSARQTVRLRQLSVQPTPELVAAYEGGRPVLRAILSRLGLDECRLAMSGGAPIDPDLIEFFQSLGLAMGDAWGMTECGVVTFTTGDGVRNGTVGRPLAGVELRVAEDGEVVVRAPSVMKGYYRDPERTAEAIDGDGWLHTGDLGELDGDGYLRIVGRKKELIITAGGKNISPANIEYLLQQHPLIGQASVVGDRRPYLTALLVLDPEAALAWARVRGIEVGSLAELAGHSEVLLEVQRAVDEANSHLARVEQVRRWRLLPAEWTVESGELTPTMKVKRRVIVDRYAREIDELYAAGGGAGADREQGGRIDS